MPTTESSAVQITINVTDGNSGQVIAQLEKSFNQAGEAGARAGGKIGGGMKEAGAHTLTALDNVRLLRDDLGIRIPRSMEKAIASSQLLMTAINGIGGALLAVGTIGVLVSLAKEAYDLYEKFIDVGGAIDEYTKKAAEAANKSFFDTASLEDYTADLRRANTELDRLNTKRSAAPTGAQMALDLLGAAGSSAPGGNQAGAQRAFASVGSRFTMDDAHRLDAEQGSIDRDNLKTLDEKHKKNVQQIEDQKTLAGALRGRAQIEAQERAELAKASEDRRFTIEKETALAQVANRGKKPTDPDFVSVAPNAGGFQQGLDTERIQAEAQARSLTLAREQSDEVTRLRNEANNAALRGDALYEAQREQAIASFEKKYGNSAAAIDAINAKFHAEQMKREADEQHAALMKLEAARDTGLTGVAAAQQRGNRELEDIGYRQDHDGLGAGAASTERNAVAVQVQQEMLDKTKDFHRQVDQLVEESADRQVAGFGRIRAEAERQKAQLQREFDQTYAGMDITKPGNQAIYDAGVDQLGRGTTSIDAGAARQAQELAKKNADETAQIEAEANRKSLKPDDQKSQEIIDQYNERLRKYQEERDAELASDKLTADDKFSVQQDYNRRVIAAEKEKNAELQDLALETQKKLEATLQGAIAGLIQNPIKELEKLGTEAASKFGSKLLVNLTSKGQAGTRGALSGTLSDVFGLGHHGKAGTAGSGPAGTSLPGAPHLGGGSAAMSIVTATITIERASIMGGGGGRSVSSGSSSGSGGSAGASGASGGSGLPDIGAGSGSSSTGASTPNSTGAGETAPQTTTPLATVEKGAGAASDIGSLADTLGLGKKGGTAGAGSAGVLSGSQPASGLKGIANKLGGYAQGALGLFAASQSAGGFGGALGGALGGAQLGGMIGGPIGAGIGALAGAALGFIGFGGLSAAQHYDHHTVQPRIQADTLGLGMGSMDYSSAYSDLDNLQNEAHREAKSWGPSGQGYYQNTIKSEIRKAQANLTREERAGRSQVGQSAAQFHDGGPISGFGSLGTSADEGWIHAQRGEFVVQQNSAAYHRHALDMMNSGASHSAVADYYGAGRSNNAAAARGGATHNWTVTAWDSKSVTNMLSDHKHNIRAALNDSYSEYSGGADA